MRLSIASRQTPKTEEAESLVFVTKYGAGWAKDSVDNPITKAFRKLLDATELHREGLGFYTIRHVFRTIADEARDQPAANAIMGHADGSMAAVYRERISDERLRAVTDHVRAWLFPKKVSDGVTKDPPTPAKEPKAKRTKKSTPESENQRPRCELSGSAAVINLFARSGIIAVR